MSNPPNYVVALIVAAGQSSRLPGDVPKPYRQLAGKAVLRHSVERFVAHPAVAEVRVVINPDHRAHYDAAMQGLDLPEPIAGGATRQQSVYQAIQAVAADVPDWVLIHDAARPAMSHDLMDRVLQGLAQHSAVIPALAVNDTIKQVAGDRVVATPDRSALMAAQTPQGFQFETLRQAHERAQTQAGDYTDDASIAEAAGVTVHWVAGDADNRKLTRLDDWHYFQWRYDGAMETRTGMGLDVHQLIEDAQRPLMICGVEVPSDLALKGHSDADVGLHALVDALLGAIGAGDIGQHFPPSDDRWKDAPSADFVRHAVGLIAQKSGRIVQVDVTMIGEKPRISTHRDAMREAVAGLLGITPDRVNIKATTTEKLGFTGRGEGLAAQAVATVEVPR